MSPSSAPAHPVLVDTEVVSNAAVCEMHRRLTLRAATFPDARPGQFVQIHCAAPASRPDVVDRAPNDGEAVPRVEAVPGIPFLRRPFSMADMRVGADGTDIDILYKIIGRGTDWMAQRRPGDRVNILGPLGHPFRIDPNVDVHVLLGGGVGLPPIMWLAAKLAAAGQRVVAICGARSAPWLPAHVVSGAPRDGEALPLVRAREFGDAPVLVTTDDGSMGLRGTVVDGFRAWRQAAPDAARARLTLYACGPERMLRAVAEVAMRETLDCQVCLERMMGCGMGTCQSCVVPIRDAAASAGWRYRLCCTDGPVFDARDVLW